jgi:CheY-like chemotaxis protein
MAKIVNSVLIIDDDPHQLTATRVIMQRFGFEVITAPDGTSGLERAQNDRPDLIICDMQMPHMNGMQVRTLLSENPFTADIPFIFVTARTYECDKLAGLSKGADDYITKPFHPQELNERVRAVLRRQEAGRRQGRIEAHEKTELVLRFLYQTRQAVGKEAQCVERMVWTNPLDKNWTLNSRAEVDRRLDSLSVNAVFPLVIACFSLTGLNALAIRAGCQMLDEVIENLYDALGGGTLLFRLGLEHFAVLLPHNGLKVKLLEKSLRSELAESRQTLGSVAPRLHLVTVTIQQGEHVSAMLEAAEATLNAKIAESGT